MDHLSYPENPVSPPLRVPHLVRDIYNDIFQEAGFDGYPEAAGDRYEYPDL